jgi:predicted MFS family arabinose efflux permease
MTKSPHNLTPFLLLCLIGFAAFFSSYLRIPVMPLFAATLGAGPAQAACAVVMGVGMALTFTAIGAMIAELIPAVQRGLAMGMYNSSIYLGMMAGSTVMGIALNRIGYPICFAAAGSTSLVSLILFFMMMREKQLQQAGRD